MNCKSHEKYLKKFHHLWHTKRITRRVYKQTISVLVIILLPKQTTKWNVSLNEPQAGSEFVDKKIMSVMP